MPNVMVALPNIGGAGGAENARLENAELENAAPNCRTGKRENGLVMESRSILNNRHTSRCYFKTDDCC